MENEGAKEGKEEGKMTYIRIKCHLFIPSPSYIHTHTHTFTHFPSWYLRMFMAGCPSASSFEYPFRSTNDRFTYCRKT